MLANNTDMRMAETLAFGKNVRFRAEGSSEKCVSLAALMTFTGSRVLITAIAPDPGESGLDQGSSLSAYFFRESGSTLRLVTVKRDFAESNGALGNVGDINAAHFGADDGMMVNGGISQQGYSNDLTDFYVFRNGSIVRLGMVPTGWSNSGAEEDDSKAVTIAGRIETGLPQPDRVRVTYTRSVRGDDERSSVAIWRSQAGKFVLEAGSVPEEIITGFELAGDVIARNGTPVPATDASPPPSAAGTSSHGVWSIDDIGMVPPSSDVTEAIKHDSNYPPICKLTGREMLPSLSATNKTWFVTTSNRCDAGGGTGPVWIVSVAPTGKASVVFSAFRHAVKAENGLHGEFHDMFVNGDARNPKSGEIYTFDGVTYRKSGS
ncbi:hypothetical protein [Rhizobium sp. 11_C7_N12_5]|uniref:hypothetical protein n=1 Tax=Rhizobium sp. 11_C7_N12_5 TaxID=3240770 RepID=UPI003F1E80C4